MLREQGKIDIFRYIRPFLLECPAKDIRSRFALLLTTAFKALERHQDGDTDTREVKRNMNSQWLTLRK